MTIYIIYAEKNKTDNINCIHENCCLNVFWVSNSSHKIHVICVVLCVVYALNYLSVLGSKLRVFTKKKICFIHSIIFLFIVALREYIVLDKYAFRHFFSD